MNNFRLGLRDGVPIAIGYVSVSFSFGIAAVAAGLTWWQALLISMTNLTSSGQFAGISIIANAGAYMEMAMTQFVINLRYSLMGISLSQKLDDRFKAVYKVVLGHAITDEIFAVSMSGAGKVTPSYFLGLSLLPYGGWSLGTLLGAVCGNILPVSVSTALGIAIYGMFIAILVPVMKESRAVLKVVLLAVAISCCIYYLPAFQDISAGTSIIICAVAASVVGALLFPIEEGGEEQ